MAKYSGVAWISALVLVAQGLNPLSQARAAAPTYTRATQSFVADHSPASTLGSASAQSSSAPHAGAAAANATPTMTATAIVVPPPGRQPTAQRVYRSRLTASAGSQPVSISYNDFSDMSNLTLNGNAAQAGSVLRLTTAAEGQAGSAFFNQPIDLSQPFETHFALSMHDSDSLLFWGPGDGMALVIQNDPRGVNAIGGSGGSLGYGTGDPITPSAIVEFDTFKNSERNDPPTNHVAIMQDGDESTHNNPVIYPDKALYNTTYNAWVDYSPANHKLLVYLTQDSSKPGTPIIAFTLTSSVTSGPAYIGFTAATGGAHEFHDVLNWQLSGTASGAGYIPWHPHLTTGLSDGVSTSVDLADGHVDVHAPDLQVAGLGLDPALSHNWDSIRAANSAATTTGNGWMTNLDSGMGGDIAGTVVYTDTTGATWPFTYTASLPPTELPGYESPPGFPWQLNTSATGAAAAYELTNILTGDVLTFNTSGRLVADADVYGNANTLSADASTYTNSNGRKLTLGHDPSSSLLQEVKSPQAGTGGTDSPGQDVQYGYLGCDAGNLCSITRGGAATPERTSFAYTDQLLTQITTGGGTVWTLQYNDARQLTALTSPSAGFSISYGDKATTVVGSGVT